MATEKKTKAMLLEEIEQKNEELKGLKKEIEKLEKYKQYEDMANELKAMYDSFVNSGFDETQAFKLMLKLFEVAPAFSNTGMSSRVSYRPYNK